jgi:hypothetical protein
MNLSPINPSDEFLRHAADCQQMAKFTRDPASKATWRRMAERWLHCAKCFRPSARWPSKGPRNRTGAAAPTRSENETRHDKS